MIIIRIVMIISIIVIRIITSRRFLLVMRLVLVFDGDWMTLHCCTSQGKLHTEYSRYS